MVKKARLWKVRRTKYLSSKKNVVGINHLGQGIWLTKTFVFDPNALGLVYSVAFTTVLFRTKVGTLGIKPEDHPILKQL